MAKLKLGAITDDKAVKLTVELVRPYNSDVHLFCYRERVLQRNKNIHFGIATIFRG